MSPRCARLSNEYWLQPGLHCARAPVAQWIEQRFLKLGWLFCSYLAFCLRLRRCFFDYLERAFELVEFVVGEVVEVGALVAVVGLGEDW